MFAEQGRAVVVVARGVAAALALTSKAGRADRLSAAGAWPRAWPLPSAPALPGERLAPSIEPAVAAVARRDAAERRGES